MAVARTMTTSPKIFLMDEPITNLDPPSRVRMREKIRQWHAELSATTLYVTHNITDAFAMADRMAIMRDGRLFQVGTRHDLAKNPAEEFVRDYLRSWPCSKRLSCLLTTKNHSNE